MLVPIARVTSQDAEPYHSSTKFIDLEILREILLSLRPELVDIFFKAANQWDKFLAFILPMVGRGERKDIQIYPYKKR